MSFILHHYELSPYSEKIRAMLGYLDLPWQSCLTKEMPPRPMLEPLAGGYRKIPVGQIGADVFCDSHTIATELAHLGNKPELAHENCNAQAAEFIKSVEGDTFFACVMYSSSMKLNRKVMKSLSLLDVAKLLIDRINMGRKANIKMVTPKAAPHIVKEFLPRLENALTNTYLFGDTPTIADFSAYHCVWFIRDLGEKPIIFKYPKVIAWMDRIKAFGHGNRQEITPQEALNIAKNNEPRPISDADKQHDAIDKTVEIAPADYGLNPTLGVLKGSTKTTWIIAREHDQTGLVHVHFPKAGYTLKTV